MITLLQAADADHGKVIIPRMKITDQPYASYRGLMVDLARQWHPIDAVKQAVVLCQWYKIGYLQLHFTDDQSWTFPSTAYPKLATPGTAVHARGVARSGVVRQRTRRYDSARDRNTRPQHAH